MLKQNQQRLDEIQRHLNNQIKHKLDLNRERLSGLRQRLSLLEHKNVLKRGYSICYRRADKHIVRHASELKKDDGIEVEFYEGKAYGT
ncbi:hypothetical protein GWO43_25435, partial [candidate division KSB1 bacterium]|nr:hypothetical protein [candidate division KSB1 bacterium]NIT74154.1 hypothetical protein [candidate division KSB1 bacterium]NIW72435.1 hypothetical protein [candidate division KSB1 bacterium]NIX73834.1 hypothetical protein [candidate division KSB1 bacterium]